MSLPILVDVCYQITAGTVCLYNLTDLDAGGEFGSSVAMAADTLVGGALIDDEGSNAGAVYVFQ